MDYSLYNNTALDIVKFDDIYADEQNTLSILNNNLMFYILNDYQNGSKATISYNDLIVKCPRCGFYNLYCNKCVGYAKLCPNCRFDVIKDFIFLNFPYENIFNVDNRNSCVLLDNRTHKLMYKSVNPIKANLWGGDEMFSINYDYQMNFNLYCTGRIAKWIYNNNIGPLIMYNIPTDISLCTKEEIDYLHKISWT